MRTPATAELYQASIGTRVPLEDFVRLSSASVLVAGLGVGSNVAELLLRKGVGRFILADPGVYDYAHVRHRGSLASTWGRSKAQAMRERLLDIHPRANVTSVGAGLSPRNIGALLDRADYVIDALDCGSPDVKAALHRECRRRRKIALCPFAALSGAALWVFTPDGPSFESFFGRDVCKDPETTLLRILQRLVPDSPPLPRDIARVLKSGRRALPPDAAGADQAAVLCAAALENLILGRRERVITVPKGLLVDVSDPSFLARVLEEPDPEPNSPRRKVSR